MIRHPRGEIGHYRLGAGASSFPLEKEPAEDEEPLFFDECRCIFTNGALASDMMGNVLECARTYGCIMRCFLGLEPICSYEPPVLFLTADNPAN